MNTHLVLNHSTCPYLTDNSKTYPPTSDEFKKQGNIGI